MLNTEKFTYFWGKVWCFLHKYTLENYDYDFTGDKYQLQQYQDLLSLIKKIRQNKSLRHITTANMTRLTKNLPALLRLYIGLKINKACIDYITKKYYFRLGEDKRKLFLKHRIWGSLPGRRWHEALQTVYQENPDFLKVRQPLIKSILELNKQDYNGIIEIGSGNGWFLNILSQKINHPVKILGLDLNPQTVKQAQHAYKNTGLRFECADLVTYSKNNPHFLTNKLIVSCFVLEFFSEAELSVLAEILNKNAPCYLAILERASRQQTTSGSLPIDGFSYTHAYVKFFESRGLKKISSSRIIDKNSPDFINLTAMFKAFA